MFLIVDGSSLLNWQYYGQLNANDKERKEASDAVIDFLLKLIQKYGFNHVAVCMDMSRETTFRRQIYPEYKAQRSATPKEYKEQIPKLIEKLNNLGIKVLEDENFEADDFAGSLSTTFSKEEPCVLISKDQDYLQLVSDSVTLWLFRSEDKVAELTAKYGEQFKVNKKIFAFTPEIVKAEYQLNPSQIIDWKGLSGDSSDNIPGVKGLGSASIPLLQKYGRIEDIYLDLDFCDEKIIKKEWKKDMGLGPSKYKYMIEQKRMALLSKELATICRDLPVGTIDQYQISFA